MPNVSIRSDDVLDLMKGITAAPATGTWQFKASPYSAFQAVETGAGVVTATVLIECSNDGVVACATPLGTITLNAAGPTSDGFATIATWKYVRARVTAIGGAGATINVTMGI